MKPTLEQVSRALADGTITGDGHTIFSPEYYAPHFPEKMLRKAGLIRVQKSDYSDPKSTIYGNDGNPIEKLEGVYNLSFLYWLCGALGIDSYNDYNGRGSQAQELVRRIRAQYPTAENEAVAE